MCQTPTDLDHLAIALNRRICASRSIVYAARSSFLFTPEIT